MNRQAVAFLSMFTLILMLSIYYVSLESDPVTVNSSNNDVNSVIALMQEKISDSKNEEIQKQKEILGSNEQDEQKNQAMETIAQLEEDQKKEKEIIQTLKELNLKSVVEIKESIIQITIYEQSENEELATQILNLVYPFMDENYSMELSFS